MYDPGTGRLLSVDPLGFEGGDVNLYRYAHNDPVNRRDPSGLLECDDRENAPGNRRLVNVDGILEDHVNGIIRDEWGTHLREVRRLEGRGGRDPAVRNQVAMHFARAVYRRLGADVPGTGINVGPLPGVPVARRSVAQITGIEVWLKDPANLSSDRNQINQIPFLQSRYRFNQTGRPIAGEAPWWFVSTELEHLNHGIAPTIRINGVLMGTDKWGHFFQQGFWVFEQFIENQMQAHETRVAFCNYLEGNYSQEGRPAGELGRLERIAQRYGTASGMQGSRASGVISQADINANLGGFEFYRRLYLAFVTSANFRFQVGDYDTRSFNEATVTPNRFVRGVSADDSDRAGPRTPIVIKR